MMAVPKSPRPRNSYGPIDQLADKRGREIEQLRAELEMLRAERDEDVRAVAEACADFNNDEGPRGIRQLYARFADRIAALGAATCECGCVPGQPCICTLNDCDCIGDCPICDAEEAEHA